MIVFSSKQSQLNRAFSYSLTNGFKIYAYLLKKQIKDPEEAVSTIMLGRAAVIAVGDDEAKGLALKVSSTQENWQEHVKALADKSCAIFFFYW